MAVETLRYAADSVNMVSELYYDDSQSGARPGVLVFPEAFGLGENARMRAERLAQHGYAALACDIYGDAKLLTSFDEVVTALAPLMRAPERIRAIAQGGLDALRARPEVDSDRIASIGFCFGGTLSLELARSGADIKGVVGFHSALGTTRPEDAKNIKGKVLVCIGADDPGATPEQRAAFETEMREGQVDWRMHLYGGVLHSFTNMHADRVGRPDFARYDAGADKRSEREMHDFLREIFGTG